jgi:pimeloyl-ACP methyl ester carboxylesterase
MHRYTFPVGYHDFHKNKNINFQLNRWHSLGFARPEDMREAGERIATIEDFKEEMVRQAERARAEGRYVNEAFYLRAAEFFVPPDDPDKQHLYEQFADRFYGQVAAGDPVKRVEIPYESGALPALFLPAAAEGTITKGTILIHGGFDSFMEEFYSMAWHLAESGYDVILFEGPGQGAALKKHGLYWDHKWEGPIGAVLDYFGCRQVVLLGISMGSWLCIRAAAFEPRITGVIYMGVGYDYLGGVPGPVAALVNFLFRFPRLMNKISWLQVRFDQQERWALYNLLHITGKETPAEAARAILDMNAENLHSAQVKQDVLLLTGAEDHFGTFNMHLKLHRRQAEALTNARSVTERIFTREEQAHNHCQVGNIGLALEVIIDWLEAVS